MAKDYDIGKLVASISLETTSLNKGVANSEKLLQSLSKSFQNSQKNINASLTLVNKSVVNSTQVLSKELNAQTKTIDNSLKTISNSSLANSRQTVAAIRSMQTAIVSELKKMNTSFEGLKKATDKDFTKGIKALQATIKSSSAGVVKDLRDIQTQAEKTQKSLDGVGNKKINTKVQKTSIPITSKVQDFKPISFDSTSISKASTDMAAGLAQANAQAKTLYGSLSNIGLTLAKLSFGIFLFRQGIGQVSDIVKGLVAPGLEFAMSMETNQVGMAGILTSMTEINGKALDFQDAMAISTNIMRELNVEAVKTAATSDELITTFRALLGPGLGAGMNIDQIKEFTVVGVNAVKSLGLDGRQLVQELRDLVQGGIQAASSTLATALGLTDSDIKRAKQSSEGLFVFLMDKIRGFARATEENGKTLKGMLDQVSEGYTLALAQSLDPVIAEIKNVLVNIRSQIFTEDLGKINPEFIENFKEIATHAMNFWNALKDIASVLSGILTPALQIAGGLLGVIADNFRGIVEVIALISFANFILGAEKAAVATNALISSQENLGAAARNAEIAAIASANNIASQERLAATQVLDSWVSTYNSVNAARQQDAQVAKTAAVLAESGYKEVADILLTMKERYIKLGMAAQDAATVQYKAAQIAKAGHVEEIAELDKLIVKHSEAAQKAEAHNIKTAQGQAILQGYTKAAGTLGITMAILGGFIKDASTEQGDFADKLGSTTSTIGTYLVGLSQILGSLKELKAAYEAVKVAAMSAGLLGGVGIVAATTLAVAKGTTALYQKYAGVSDEEASDRYYLSKKDREAKSNAQRDKEMESYNKTLRERNAKELRDKLMTRDAGGTGKGSKSKGSSSNAAAAKAAKQAYKALESELKVALQGLKEQQESLDAAYKNDLVSTQNYVEASMKLSKEQLDNEIANLEKRKEAAKAAGQESDVENFNNQINQAREKQLQLEAQATRQLVEEYKKLEDRLDSINKTYEGLVGTSEKAFKTDLIKEFSADYTRLLAESTTANQRLEAAVKSGQEADIKVWATRKESLDGTISKLKTIIDMRKLEYNATQAQAEVERIDLEIQEKYLTVKDKTNRMVQTEAELEGDLFDFRKEHMDEYIDAYTDLIAQYEKMAQIAKEQGNLEQFNSFKQQALEAKESLLELADAIPPFQKAMKEEVAGSMSDMFQEIAWGEKTAEEAFKDFAKTIAQTWTKKIFDEFATSITDRMFQGLLPSSEKVPNRKQEIETIVTQKVNSDVTVDLTQFNDDIVNGALKWQESLTNTAIPSLQTFTGTINQLVVPALQNLAVVASSIGTGSGGTGGMDLGSLLTTTTSGSSVLTSGSSGGGFTFTGGISSDLGKSDSWSSGLSLPSASQGLDFSGVNKDLTQFSTKLNFTDNTLGDFQTELGLGTNATEVNTAATTQAGDFALPMMITSLLNATGVLGDFGQILQAVMMVMQIGKTAGLFAKGGYVQGAGTSTSDSIPARLSNGEYVIKATSVKSLGVDFLDRLNNIGNSGIKRSGTLPRFAFADGGYVEDGENAISESAEAVNANDVGAAPTVVMNMNFQSLDPEANMKMMKQQYPTFRSMIIRDLQNSTSMRSAVRGVGSK